MKAVWFLYIAIEWIMYRKDTAGELALLSPPATSTEYVSLLHQNGSPRLLSGILSQAVVSLLFSAYFPAFCSLFALVCWFVDTSPKPGRGGR